MRSFITLIAFLVCYNTSYSQKKVVVLRAINTNLSPKYTEISYQLIQSQFQKYKNYKLILAEKEVEKDLNNKEMNYFQWIINITEQENELNFKSEINDTENNKLVWKADFKQRKPVSLENVYTTMIKSIVRGDSVYSPVKQIKAFKPMETIALGSLSLGYVYMKPENFNEQIRHHYFSLGVGIYGLVAQKGIAGLEFGIVSDYLYMAMFSGEYLFIKKKITPFLGIGCMVSSVKGGRNYFNGDYERNWEVNFYPKAGLYIKAGDHIWLKPSFTLLSAGSSPRTNYLYNASFSLIFK